MKHPDLQRSHALFSYSRNSAVIRPIHRFYAGTSFLPVARSRVDLCIVCYHYGQGLPTVWFSLTKTKTKTKMPKQQNLSLNESASTQYGAYGCYGRTALNPWLTVDVFRQIINTSSSAGLITGKTKTKTKKYCKTKTKLKLKNKSKRKLHCTPMTLHLDMTSNTRLSRSRPQRRNLPLEFGLRIWWRRAFMKVQIY